MSARVHCGFAPAVCGGLLLCAACWTGCGLDADGNGDDDGPDGSPGGCTMLAEITPADAVAPITLVASGSIDNPGAPGFERFDWVVQYDDQLVEVSPRTQDSRTVQFSAAEPGPYRVILSGSVAGVGCTDFVTVVNVRAPGAVVGTYRLRMIPPAGVAAPPQVARLEIPGGADRDIGTVTLQPGGIIDATVRGSDGEPIAAYVRATPVGDPALATPTEVFAGSDGQVQLRLGAGQYDVLVVPVDGGLAPALFPALPLSAISSALVLPPSDSVPGSVSGVGGAPLSGARVSLTIARVPSAMALTDAGGAFAVPARLGGAASLSVMPDGDALPRLELPVDRGLELTGGESLMVAYGAGVATRAWSLSVVAADGTTPLPGAVVRFFARPLDPGGTVTVDGAAARSARATHSAVAVADASGGLVGVSLMPAIYDVLVKAPSGGGPDSFALVVGDFTGAPGPSPALGLAAPATVRGQLLGLGAGVSVTASPLGPAAVGFAPAARALSDGAGEFALALIGGASYSLEIQPPPGSGRAPARLSIEAPSPGADLVLTPIELGGAISITGTVERVDGAGQRDVTVGLFCADCSGPAAAVPLAETVTGPGGSFELRLPDPGVITALRSKR